MADEKRVIVVGGGLAGLAASVRIAEAGVPVAGYSGRPNRHDCSNFRYREHGNQGFANEWLLEEGGRTRH